MGRAIAAETKQGYASESAIVQGAAVSPDLLEIYSRTGSAKSESELTEIARACARVLAGSERSKADIQYASNLLAWSLNRRGELRSQQSLELTELDQIEQADKMDQLAIDDFATAAERAPSNWRYRHNYAVSLVLRGDYTRALQQLDQTIQLNKQYPNAYFNRAEIYFESGKYEAADKDYSSAIELAEEAVYFNGRGHCRFLMHEFAAALADYRRAAELGRDDAAFHTDLGDACQYLGQWAEAAKAYRAAVAANNRYLRAYQNAAWLMATCPQPEQRNPELAVSAAKKALELSTSRTAELVETLAAAHAASGRFDDAIQLQQEAMLLARRDPAAEEGMVQEYRQRIDLYQQGQAYLQPQPATLISSVGTAQTTAAVK
ncbi:MAG: tetratricopeptide repeat protein [Pirellulaceae bacterium]|nr:tetratricopeptide repeat protein [Pirellulaceae bacterium]